MAEAEAVQKIIEAARATPPGHKKDTGAAMTKGYCPPAVEAAWCVSVLPVSQQLPYLYGQRPPSKLYGESLSVQTFPFFVRF